MARRPRYRRRNQQALDLLERVQRANERIEAAEEQLSDETHIPEDNTSGTLRIENGIAYLNGRSLGEIEEPEEEIGDAGGIRTGSIEATHLQVGTSPDELEEQMERIRTSISTPFPYQVRERLGSIELGGVNAQPNSDYFTREQWSREYMSLFAPRDEESALQTDAPAIRGLNADSIYRAETEEDIVWDGVREELANIQPTVTPETPIVERLSVEEPLETPEEAEHIARLREELMEIGRNAVRDTIGTTQDIATTQASQIGGNVGIQGGALRIDTDGITAGRIMPENLEGFRIDNRAVGGVLNTSRTGWATLTGQKRYVFDEEKVNTLMDTIRVVRAIMSNFNFSEEQIRELHIEDLVRER